MKHYSVFVILIRNPTPSPVDNPDGIPVTWEPYTDSEYNYLLFSNDMIEMRRDYRQQDYAFWREYLPYLIYGEDLKGCIYIFTFFFTFFETISIFYCQNPQHNKHILRPAEVSKQVNYCKLLI